MHIDTDNDLAHDSVRALMGCGMVDRSNETTFEITTTVQQRSARSSCMTCLKQFQFLASLEKTVCVDETDDGVADSKNG